MLVHCTKITQLHARNQQRPDGVPFDGHAFSRMICDPFISGQLGSKASLELIDTAHDAYFRVMTLHAAHRPLDYHAPAADMHDLQACSRRRQAGAVSKATLVTSMVWNRQSADLPIIAIKLKAKTNYGGF